MGRLVIALVVVSLLMTAAIAAVNQGYAVGYGDDDATKSARQYNQILTEHPDIAGIISPTTVGILAAAQEKKTKGSKVAITGLGLPSQMKNWMSAMPSATIGTATGEVTNAPISALPGTGRRTRHKAMPIARSVAITPAQRAMRRL